MAPFQSSPSRFIAAMLFALLAMHAGGCGKADDSSTTAVPRALPSGSGLIHGQIFFDAPAPQRKVVSPPDNPAHVLDETVVVNPNGTLKNVIVYLKDAPPGDGGGPTVLLDQVNFQYVPHVLALQVAQPLVVRNSDDHMHDVHIDSTINRPDNLRFSTVGEKPPITFKAPEFFQIRCDVHPWMVCQVGVFDHPYFAVTGDDGSFTIKNVPPGQYTLVARHERFGELSQPVTAANNQTIAADFHYKPPAELK